MSNVSHTRCPPRRHLNARCFGTVAGGTGTDALVSSVVDNATLRSISAWVWLHPDNNTSSLLRIFAFGGTTEEMLSRNNAHALVYLRGRSTTAGQWSLSSFTTANYPTWVHVGFVIDNGDTANNGQFYINGTAKTTGEVATPSGTLTTISSGLYVGNNSTGTAEWHGMIAEVALWNTLLDPADFRALAQRCHPRKIRPTNLTAYCNVHDGTVNGRRVQINGAPLTGGPF